MKVRGIVTDDKAVSPVIGVILMVAITVILAAVIGTFVLGFGNNQTTTPSASFGYDYNTTSQNLTIVHDGGDSFTAENSRSLRVSYTDTGGTANTEAWANQTNGGFPVEAVDSYEPTNSVQAGSTVRLLWEGPDGSSSQAVSSYDVPS